MFISGEGVGTTSQGTTANSREIDKLVQCPKPKSPSDLMICGTFSAQKGRKGNKILIGWNTKHAMLVRQQEWKWIKGSWSASDSGIPDVKSLELVSELVYVNGFGVGGEFIAIDDVLLMHGARGRGRGRGRERGLERSAAGCGHLVGPRIDWNDDGSHEG